LLHLLRAVLGTTAKLSAGNDSVGSLCRRGATLSVLLTIPGHQRSQQKAALAAWIGIDLQTIECRVQPDDLSRCAA
jgi:hypothetical protein